MAQPESITINGNNYSISSLSEAARSQVANIQAVDAEIARLQLQIGIARTARNAYVGALAAALPALAQAQPAAVAADESAVAVDKPAKKTPKSRAAKG